MLVCFSLIGCDEHVPYSMPSDAQGDMFTLVGRQKIKLDDHCYMCISVVYDNDTKVMYMESGYGLVMMRDADGNPKIYGRTPDERRDTINDNEIKNHVDDGKDSTRQCSEHE